MKLQLTIPEKGKQRVTYGSGHGTSDNTEQIPCQMSKGNQEKIMRKTSKRCNTFLQNFQGWSFVLSKDKVINSGIQDIFL